MRSLFLLSLLVVLAELSSDAIAAAENSILPPKLPMQARAPDFSHWTEIYTYKDGDKDNATAGTTPSNPTATAPQEPFRIKQIDYTKTRGIMHIVTTFTRNIQENRWIIDGKQMVMRTGFPFPIMLSGHEGIKVFDFSRTDFPDFQWVLNGKFIGEKVQSGQKYWAFQENGSLEDDPSHSNSPLTASTSSPSPVGEENMIMAEVDETSLLPVLLQSTNQTRTYQFNSPPTEMLQIEPEFQKLLDHLNLEENAYARRPAIRKVFVPAPKP
jgi:hypothetical protein